jgi:hypothetical protein
MPIQVQGNGGVTTEVEDSTTRALRAVIKPYGYTTLGHYKVTLSILSTAVQVANARLAVLRNNAANLLVLTRATMRAQQEVAGTVQQNAIDAYKLTGFTVLDTTGTLTPTVTECRVTEMAAAPGGAQVRTVATATAAGMTGATSTKGGLIGSLPYDVKAAIAQAGFGPTEIVDPGFAGAHPLILKQNEGILWENRTLNVTSYGIRWYIDLAWAEVATF